MQPTRGPFAGPALPHLGGIRATASRQLQVASANAIVRRGNCRAASLLARGGRAQLIGCVVRPTNQQLCSREPPPLNVAAVKAGAEHATASW